MSRKAGRAAFGTFGTFAASMLLALLAHSSACAALLDVSYPRSPFANDQRREYYIQLLDLALSKTGVPYNLHSGPLTTASIVQQLADQRDGIDVTWAPDTREYDEQLLPIRIPIDKGILGWRLFLIKARDRDAFARIQTLDQLKAYSAGLHRLWPDTAILRANGLTVAEGTEYDKLFVMLAADRFQYFPRGIGEIWKEQESHADLKLIVDPHLALHYPVNTYFFVGKSKARLARLIEQGLRAAYRDGSFDKLFQQYNGEAIKRAGLDNRVIFELANPVAPPVKPALKDDHPIRSPGTASH